MNDAMYIPYIFLYEPNLPKQREKRTEERKKTKYNNKIEIDKEKCHEIAMLAFIQSGEENEQRERDREAL